MAASKPLSLIAVAAIVAAAFVCAVPASSADYDTEVTIYQEGITDLRENYPDGTVITLIKGATMDLSFCTAAQNAMYLIAYQNGETMATASAAGSVWNGLTFAKSDLATATVTGTFSESFTLRVACTGLTKDIIFTCDGYAGENPNTFGLSFKGNGGSGVPSDITRTATGSTCQITIPNTVPVRDGYEFAGWATTSGGSVAYQNGDKVTVSANSTVTLYAKWMLPTYDHILYFDMNGGSSSDYEYGPVVSQNENEDIVIPAIETVKPYSTFLGWAHTPSGEVAYQEGDAVTVGPDETVYLFAKWESVQVEITSVCTNSAVVVGNTFTYQVETNVEGASITISGPEWLSVVNGKVVGTPTEAGSFPFTVSVSYGTSTDAQAITLVAAERLAFESVPTGGILATPVI